MQDVIRRQREEIEKLKTKDRDATTVCHALEKGTFTDTAKIMKNLVNTYYDNQIADFTQKNESESTSNKNREKRIENLTKSKNSTIESTARSEKEHVQIVAQIKANKDKQIADARKVEFKAPTSYIGLSVAYLRHYYRLSKMLKPIRKDSSMNLRRQSATRLVSKWPSKTLETNYPMLLRFVSHLLLLKLN